GAGSDAGAASRPLALAPELTPDLADPRASASSSTSAIVRTGLTVSLDSTCSGISDSSGALAAGMITVVIPARVAASSFSLSPPIGSTLPRNVSSPVMATSWRTGTPEISDTSAQAMVTPADGPSLGTAPDGTWMWISRPA